MSESFAAVELTRRVWSQADVEAARMYAVHFGMGFEATAKSGLLGTRRFVTYTAYSRTLAARLKELAMALALEPPVPVR